MAGMHNGFDSTERGPRELFMFALGFIGFLVGTGGVILLSAPLALFGLLLFLLSVLSFRRHPLRGE